MGRKVTVVGAGLAGLYAAHSAAVHGADVTLYEKSKIGTRHSCGEMFTEIYTSAPEECKLNKINILDLKFNDSVFSLSFSEELTPFVMTDKCKHEFIMKEKCERAGVKIYEKFKGRSESNDSFVIDASGTSKYNRSMGKAVVYIVDRNILSVHALYEEYNTALFIMRKDLLGYSWIFPRGREQLNIGEGVYDYKSKVVFDKPDKKYVIYSGGGLIPMCNMGDYYENSFNLYNINLLKIGNAAGLVNPCVLPNTEIITSNGVKEIKDILVGDKVFTHEGRFRQVTKTFVRDYEGDVIEIRPSVSSKSVTLTPEHPVYSSSRCICRWKGYESRFCWYDCRNSYQGNGGQSGRCLYGGCKYKFYENYLDNITWTNSGNLNINQSLCYPVMKNECEFDVDNYIIIGNSEIFIGYDLMKFIGYYIAEGHGAKNGSRTFLDFGLTSNETECMYVNEISDLADSLFNKKAYIDIDYKGRQRISINNIYITKFLSDNFGRVSKEKMIPEWIMNLNNDLLVYLVRGMWNGDGCTKEPNQYTYYTTSKNLAYTLKIILNKLGVICKVKIDNRINRLSSFSDGDYYSSGGYSIVVSASFINKMNYILGKDEDTNVIKPKNGHNKMVRIRSRLLDDTIISCIDSISHNYYKGKVYNLEVEEDNSYCTESVTLHNCAGGGEHLAAISGILAGCLVARKQESKYKIALNEIIGDEMRIGITFYELAKKQDEEFLKMLLRQIFDKKFEDKDIERINKNMRKTIAKWIPIPDVDEEEMIKFAGE